MEEGKRWEGQRGLLEEKEQKEKREEERCGIEKKTIKVKCGDQTV